MHPSIDFRALAPQRLSPTLACSLLRLSRYSAFYDKICPEDETPAMRIGILAHERVLTPDAKNTKNILEKETCLNARQEEVPFSRRNKDAREWIDRQKAEGKRVFSVEEDRIATEMAETLKLNATAQVALAVCSEREKYYRWVQSVPFNGGVRDVVCSTRIDAHGETLSGKPYIVSYKTTFSKNPEEALDKGFRNFFYDVQSVAEAFALDALGIAPFTEEDGRLTITPTCYIVQSSQPPYDSFCPTHDDMDIIEPLSAFLWNEALHRFLLAGDEIRKFGSPRRAYHQDGNDAEDIATGNEIGRHIGFKMQRTLTYRNESINPLAPHAKISDMRGKKLKTQGDPDDTGKPKRERAAFA